MNTPAVHDSSFFSMFKVLLKSLDKRVSLPWAGLLLLLLVSFAIAKYFGALIEDLQLFIFPLMLLIVRGLPKDRALRMPIPLLGLACLLWLSTTAQLSGVLPANLTSSHVLLSRLSDDHSGLKARGLYQQLNLIAKIYNLPPTDLLHRSLEQDDHARTWFGKQPLSPFILRGDTRWLRAVFPLDSSPYFEEFSGAATAQVPAAFQENAQGLGLSLGKTVLPVRPKNIDKTFGLLFLTESLKVPDEPVDLGRHYLAWLAQALERFPQTATDTSARITTRRAALIEASQISGQWKSHASIGFSNYLLGTQDLLEALASGVEQPALLQSALDYLGIASSYIRRDTDPELFAAVFNNAAVAQLMVADTKKKVRKAEKWLQRAATTREANGKISLANRTALLNLMSLGSASE